MRVMCCMRAVGILAAMCIMRRMCFLGAGGTAMGTMTGVRVHRIRSRRGAGSCLCSTRLFRRDTGTASGR